MLSWKIGEVTISRLVEFEVPYPYHEKYSFLKDATPDALRAISWLHPHFVTDDGALKLSVHALLIDAPGMKLVVDTCVGNDKARKMLRGQVLRTAFLESLAEAGFGRDEVDAVVCTHLHYDHVGWNTMLENGKWVPTFPKARYLIGRAEYEHWMKETETEAVEIMTDSVTPIFDAGLVELVEMNHRISPELRLMPSVGHTEGHVCVVIESKGRTAIITGDMMHHPCQIAYPEWISEFDADKRAAEATRRTLIKDWADQPILVIGTHFAAPTAGRIKRDGARYRFEV